MSDSLTDRVIDGIRAMILSGRLGPGDQLPVEADLAAELAVSRGPLREGVRALCQLGVLTSRRGAGTYVTGLTMAGLLEPLQQVADLQREASTAQLHQVRRVLEAEAAALAAMQVLAGASADALQQSLDDARTILREDPGDHEGLLAADLALHRGVAALAGNPVLAGFIDVLAGQTARSRLWRARVDAGVAERSVAEHAAVLAAISDGDPERARLRMSVHLLEQEDFLGP
ncbi:FadR/GntR family transcriptional regulator [Ruania albidiflava]|uniref:FadR/GntR family transcriptional regulator n=1 Tax=Ruania albidiflava TaxID=366586 RepID=UPI0003B3C3FD|nr:FCD domain-containing protein [Ruania albidiflava]